MGNKKWLFFCDGAARGNPGPAAAAFIGFDVEGGLIGKGRRFLGKATNNEAEYQAVLMCLGFVEKEKAEGRGVRWLMVFSDSQLLVNQMSGVYKVKDKKLQQLVMEAKRREGGLGMGVKYVLVPREVNFWADRLVNVELDGR